MNTTQYAKQENAVNVSNDNDINFRINMLNNKNLFAGDNLPDKNLGGVSINTDGAVEYSYITMHGTTNDVTYIYTKTFLTRLKAGKYTFSIRKVDGTYTANSGATTIYLRFSNDINIVSREIGSIESTGYVRNTFTLTEDTDIYFSIYSNKTGQVFNLYSLRFQIEKGTSATSYQAYVPNLKNTTYIDNNKFSDSVNVGKEVDDSFKVNFLKSKNLNNINIPNNQVYGVNFTVSKGKITLDGTTTGEGTIVGTLANQVSTITLKAGTYTISNRILSGTFTRTTKDVAIYFRKSSDGTIIFSSNGELNFTKTSQITLSEDTTIYFSAYTNGAGTIFNNLVLGLQIEKGSTATAYEPYITPKININGENLFYANEYSATEQVIGKWKDGKPIYRSVIEYTLSIDTSTYFGTYTGAADLIKSIDTLVDYKFYVYNGTLIFPIPNGGGINNNRDSGIYIQRSYGGIGFQCSANSINNCNGKQAQVILEYTKTTD